MEIKITNCIDCSGHREIEICESCEKEIPEGTGDKFLDRSCGYRFWLCDECIEEGGYY